MPNGFAYFMLFAWPVVTVVLFLRLPVGKAAAASMIAGYLLLPTAPTINFPMVPNYGRELAAALPALVMALIMWGVAPAELRGAKPRGQLQIVEGWLPRPLLLKVCVIALVVTPFFTALTNGDTAVIGGKVIPGLGLYDGASNVVSAAFALIPFFLARKWFAHPRDHAMLLGLLCLAGLAYSFLALWEIRMSPQLNRTVYGFFPHQWGQHLREDGYRPLVFLEHGLRLGIFMTVVVLATLGYARTREGGKRWLIWLAALWLFGTLVLCKSVGALILATLFAPVILLFGARGQVMIAAVFAAIVLLYPMARGTGLVPVETIRSTLSGVVGSGRMLSLDFRLRNEDVLLERARERPLFGWGGWGRNQIYDEDGRMTTVTDGTWIIYFGKDGWVGYLAAFGLLTFPIMLLAARRRNALTIASSALALTLAANLIDLIPNSGLTPLTWLMAGAIAGRLELGRVEDAAPEAAPVPVQASPYRRNFPGGAVTTRRHPLRPRPVGRANPRRAGSR